MPIRLKRFVVNPYAVFILALLVSSALKVSRLSARELWLDETYSEYQARIPFHLFTRNLMGDVHPPLYSLLLRLWILWGGESIPHLRFLSVLLSFAATLSMAALGHRILGTRAGMYAASLFAFSPLLYVYSFEVRNYMLFVLVLTVVLYAHWKLCTDQLRSQKTVILYATAAATLFYVHYLAIFVLIGLAVHGTLTEKNKMQILRPMGTAGLLTIVLVSPGLYLLKVQHANNAAFQHQEALLNANSQSLSYSSLTHEPLTWKTESSLWAKSAAVMAGVYPAKSRIIQAVIVLPLLLAIAYAIWKAIVNKDAVCLLFLVEAAAIACGVFVLHVYSARYLLPIVPVLLLAVSRALMSNGSSRLQRTILHSGAVLVFCLYFAGFIRQANKIHGKPWENLVGTLKQRYIDDDLVVFSAEYGQIPFDYAARNLHFTPREAGFPISVEQYWSSQRNKAWGGPVILNPVLDRYTSVLWNGQQGVIWLVLFETEYYDPHEALIASLREHATVEEMSLPPDPDDLERSPAEPRLFKVQQRNKATHHSSDTSYRRTVR